MLYCQTGSETSRLTPDELRQGLFAALDKIGLCKKVLIIPPDFTRFHSQAGMLTRFAYEYYGGRLTAVLPALGTHFPLTGAQREKMFGDVPSRLFRVHDWQKELVTLGVVPASFVREVSQGVVDFDWPAQVNRLIVEGGFDRILSIGQVVPHEVIGMASYTKNIFIGAGGAEGINKSHFLGAAWGMEKIMGRADTPVRRVLDYAADHFGRTLPIVYVHTVVVADRGVPAVCGLFIGDDAQCFTRAADLSARVNITLLDKPVKKAVVYLDPEEYASTWLGNKSIYRTRMALADGAELIVLAPGVGTFGEQKEIDSLIRKYGYCGTEKVLDHVKTQPGLAAHLSAAAHLIHGSSEGRFTITYCPGKLSKDEIESVYFNWGDVQVYTKKYDPSCLVDGMNTMPDGEEIFYISNPALGLWTVHLEP